MSDLRVGAAPCGPRALPRWRELITVLMLAWGILALLAPGHAPPAPRADARRYLDYALNLRDHGVFGLTGPGTDAPLPGRANVPLYPALLAAAFAAAGVYLAALRCYLAWPARDCVPALTVAWEMQRVLAALTLTGVYLLAGQLGRSRRIAILAVVTCLASDQLQYFSRQLLTENLSLPLFVFTTLTLLRGATLGAAWASATGALLGLLALTRPEFLYLAAAIALLALLRAALARQWLPTRQAAALVGTLLLTLAPWLARNHANFGDAALTTTYGGQVLAQRVQYDRMRADELAAAFIYWLPTFGDSLAARLLPASSFARLGFGAGSYYRDGLAHFDDLVHRTGSSAAATAMLIEDEVLVQPLWHTLVTLALAWRAVFVGKLWGGAALAAFAWVVMRRGEVRAALLAASLPAWFMLLFYAAVSVSVPRYAVCMVPSFALALAFALDRILPGARAPHA